MGNAIGICKYGCEYKCIPWKGVWNERKGPEPNCFIGDSGQSGARGG